MVAVRAAESTPVPVQLDPELEKQVEWFMQRMMQSFSRKVGETISRVLYNKGNIDITDLTPGDTGVYTCTVQWGPQKARDNITVGVYSLEVTADNPTRYVFESDAMQLICNSVPLGLLFPAAVRQWFYNSTNMSAPMPTLASNISADLVPRVTKSMAGVWECRVDDFGSKRVWTTAWYRIGVQNAPSVVARTYRTLADNVYTVIIVASVVLVLLCLCFIGAVRLMKGKEDETDEEFLNTRNGWEKSFNQFGSGGKVQVKESDLPPKKQEKVESETEDKREEDANDVSSLEDVESKGSKMKLLGESEQDDDGKDVSSLDDVEGKGSELKLLGETERDNDSNEVDKHNRDNVGDDDEDDGEESDTNKSATLSQKKARQRQIIRRKNRARKRNTAFLDNDENISNIKRHATREDEVSRKFRITEKSEHRNRVDGKRKKHKQRMVYPEVSKDSALKWLIQNSPHLRKFQSILRDTDNTSTTCHVRNLGPVGSVEGGQETHHEGINRASASTCSNAQTHLWRMPEFRPPDVKTWLARGRERVSGWTSKPSSCGHSNIRYTVLPQADDDDFTDF